MVVTYSSIPVEALYVLCTVMVMGNADDIDAVVVPANCTSFQGMGSSAVPATPSAPYQLPPIFLCTSSENGVPFVHFMDTRMKLFASCAHGTIPKPISSPIPSVIENVADRV